MIWVSYASPMITVIAIWIAYRVGKRSRDRFEARERLVADELGPAPAVVRDLERISQQVRQSLASHHASIVQFKDRISKLNEQAEGGSREELSREAERILQPTIELASQIAHAYDEIRRQTDQLSAAQSQRTDPLTGFGSRRTMEDILKMLFAMKSRYDTHFALALVDIDGFHVYNDEFGHERGDEILRRFAAMLDRTVRETDVIIRFGGEEFVVIMPETDLPGAGVFGQRLRQNARGQLELAISVGVAEAREGDSCKSLLSRTDSALYSAKAAGGAAVFQHTGRHIEPARPLRITAPLETADGPADEPAAGASRL